MGDKPKIEWTLGTRDNDLTMGLEVELYLYDELSGTLNSNEDLIHLILDHLPDTIGRDYYPYQLEIKTNPCSDENSLVKEFKQNLQMACDVAGQFNCSILTGSVFETAMFNGFHIHLRYKHENDWWKMFINSYPLILSVAAQFRNGFSSSEPHIPSLRTLKSGHIGIPPLEVSNFDPTHLPRFLDITVNRNNENTRRRLKKVDTMELRLFDTPKFWSEYETIIRTVFRIYQKLDLTNDLSTRAPGLSEKLRKTREEVCSTKYPFHYVYGDHCYKVFHNLKEKLGVGRKPKETVKLLPKIHSSPNLDVRRWKEIIRRRYSKERLLRESQWN